MENNEKKLNKNSRIAVLCGGLSNEREVSLRSGRNVFKALIELGYKDVTLIDVDRNIASVLTDTKIEYAINVLHGRYGEDGCIQGVLEFLGIKYSGCGVKASSICMDKIMTKRVLSTQNIPLIKSVNVNKENYKEKVQELNYPIIIKPANEGSSIGMTKVNSIEELDNAMEVALKCDNEILIEEYLQGESATVGVLERIDENGKEEIFATPILGFRTKTDWYDYEAKYTKGLTEFILPADFSDSLTKEIQELAIKAHKACACKGVSRVDFLVYNNIPYILEVNTNPGMTDTSDLPAQANEMGINYNQLVDLILKTADLK
ncbi:MAG: D-alanine--D-alanine ligase [Candidatus Gastranaerophilales bacterium]|nr:D-alanine--D-alanine ligase [Candidatus Gastranaerophilales bacterium]